MRKGWNEGCKVRKKLKGPALHLFSKATSVMWCSMHVSVQNKPWYKIFYLNCIYAAVCCHAKNPKESYLPTQRKPNNTKCVTRYNPIQL